MFQSSGSGGNPPASFDRFSFNQEAVRHILLGDCAMTDAINRIPCWRLRWRSQPEGLTPRLGQTVAHRAQQ